MVVRMQSAYHHLIMMRRCPLLRVHLAEQDEHEPRSVRTKLLFFNMSSEVRALRAVARRWEEGFPGWSFAHRAYIRSLQPPRSLVADSHDHECSAGGHCGSCS